jgi:phage protein D
MNDVEKAERQLAFAKLAEEYDAVQVKVQDGSASDEDRGRYRELAQQVAAARSELRVEREAEAIAEGDGVARPEAVGGSSEVG